MVGIDPTIGSDACVDLARRCDIALLFAPSLGHRYKYEAPNTKIVFSWHGGPGEWAARVMATPMIRQYDVLHAVGNHSATSFPKDIRGRVRIVPNCVDPGWVLPSTDSGSFARSHGIPAARFTAAIVGRVSAEKRWHISARGAASVDGAHAVIAGGVSHSDHLNAAFPWFVRESMPNCTPVGWLRHVGDLLQMSSALVSCSDISEGCGFNMMEAALSGVPIISTRTGICMDEPDLMAVELPMDVRESHVSEAVESLMRDKRKAEAAARRAQLIVTSRYNMTEWRRNWVKFLKEI